MQVQPKAAAPETVEVEVLRSFQNHERKVLPKGATATLPRLFALEMHAANKVRIVERPEPAPAKPKGDDDRGAKGGRNAA